MNFEKLKRLARLYVPQAKINAIPDEDLETLLNEGTLDATQRLLCKKGIGTFAATANISEYIISTSLTRYLTMDEPGLWWNDGSQWVKLDPVTIKWLDNKMPNWRDTPSGNPQRYALYGDNLIIHPAPVSTLASGFKAYFIQKPDVMSDNGHYPFAQPANQSAEESRLAILSEVVLLFWEWKALKILGKGTEAIEKRNEYMAEIEEKRSLINVALDISSDKYTSMRGPSTNAPL